jgi:LmbE family N-acetylglucosaminyl deacetylase
MIRKGKNFMKKIRALMIGAHPDDCEFGAGGLAVLLSGQGHNVKFVSLTNGETGHFEKSREEVAEIRKAEMEEACKIADIECEVLDIASNAIEADIQTREKVICLIRKYKPDIIFAHRANDYHPDHRRAAILVQDSSYAVRVPLVCPETPCLRYSPVIMYMYDKFEKPAPFTPGIVINIDKAMQKKVEMLNCYVSQQYEWLPWIDGYEAPESAEERLKWFYERQAKKDSEVADKYRAEIIERYGRPGNDIKFAEAFEISEYGRKPADEELKELFPV